jgi:hypothetical protein
MDRVPAAGLAHRPAHDILRARCHGDSEREEPGEAIRPDHWIRVYRIVGKPAVPVAL